MLQVGREQLAIKGFREIIEARDCTRANFSTPPQGLFLEKVYYNDSLRAHLLGVKS
jgi:tRNA pseudouridine38-40 synthase